MNKAPREHSKVIRRPGGKAPVVIDGVHYEGMTDAAKAKNICLSTVIIRVNSPHLPGWRRALI